MGRDNAAQWKQEVSGPLHWWLSECDCQQRMRASREEGMKSNYVHEKSNVEILATFVLTKKPHSHRCMALPVEV